MNELRLPRGTLCGVLNCDYLMSDSRREDTLEVLRRPVGDFTDRYDAGSLWLFGSAARREDSASSDIDLVVAFRSTPTFDRYIDLRCRLEELLGAPVDLVTAGSLTPRLDGRIRREGVRVG